MQRAIETKQILIRDKTDEKIEELTECKADTWNKMAKLELGNGYIVCSKINYFLNRALTGINKVQESDSPALIVAHGGIHFALCYHLGIENHPWKIGNCELVHFCPQEEGGWKAYTLEP